MVHLGELELEKSIGEVGAYPDKGIFLSFEGFSPIFFQNWSDQKDFRSAIGKGSFGEAQNVGFGENPSF